MKALNCIYNLNDSKIANLNEVIRFEICSGDGRKEKEEIIGFVHCPIDRVESQEEYEVDIIVPEEKNANNPIAKIGAKMQVIKSFYQYYQELMLKSEENKRILQDLLRDSQKIFENLNGNTEVINKTL